MASLVPSPVSGGGVGGAPMFDKVQRDRFWLVLGAILIALFVMQKERGVVEPRQTASARYSNGAARRRAAALSNRVLERGSLCRSRHRFDFLFRATPACASGPSRVAHRRAARGASLRALLRAARLLWQHRQCQPALFRYSRSRTGPQGVRACLDRHGPRCRRRVSPRPHGPLCQRGLRARCGAGG